MKIAVMGAGAIGCYYGGLLARAGAEVTLIGRGILVDAVTERGLILEIGGVQERVAIGASADPAAVAGAELVLFCVKSGDTEPVGRLIAPHLAPEATILCLQNGVDNERQALRLFPNVYGVCVMLPAEHLEPGQGVAHPVRLGQGGERVATGDDERPHVARLDLVHQRRRRHLAGDPGQLRPAGRPQGADHRRRFRDGPRRRDRLRAAL